MRAAIYSRSGPAREVLEVTDIPTPEPGPGEVRVKLATSGVNPSDVKGRNGARPPFKPYTIPQSDGAGIIDAVGAGVPESRLGERVWTWNAQWKRPFGTAAEVVVLPAAMAVRLPDSVGFEAGACLGIPAMTAWRAVELAEAAPGRTLLVAGGAGAVSAYAIQFAKAAGATIITTVSSPEKAAAAREAGADHVIDYRREPVGTRVKELTGGAGVDAVLEVDIAANAHLLPEIVRPKARVVIYGTGRAEGDVPLSFCLQNSIELVFFLVYELTEDERARAVAGITAALEAGWLQNRVAARFPLKDIAAAHEAVESGRVIGNVIVDI